MLSLVYYYGEGALDPLDFMFEQETEESRETFGDRIVWKQNIWVCRLQGTILARGGP